MMLPQIIENIYTNKSSSWFIDLDDSLIQPFLIQRWLVMNKDVRVQVGWLDKYVFNLPPKMWLGLAWSVIPKYPKNPFVRFIKKVEPDTEFEFILTRVKKEFNMSDNDMNAMKTRLIESIKNDMPTWFKYYGIEKTYWKQYYLNFDGIKEEENKKEKTLFDF
jgi:hypothetical protein